MYEEPTLGEISKDLRALKKESAEDMDDLKKSLARLVDAVERTYVRLDVYRAEQESVQRRVDRVEERLTWVSRAAVTGLLLPALVTLILALFMAGGPP